MICVGWEGSFHLESHYTKISVKDIEWNNGRDLFASNQVFHTYLNLEYKLYRNKNLLGKGIEKAQQKT